MESFLNRYKNITVLLLVIFAQLLLLAVQVKNEQNVRFIRVWAVTAVSPFARLVEGVRGTSSSFVRNYVTLHDADAENRRLKAENAQLKLDKVFLENQLNTADRAKALELFQQQTKSKTIAATVISIGLGSSRKVVYVDRGSVAGVMREMAVLTPDGIVGKVTNVYPMASEVLLITDITFGAGVVSGKGHVHGTVKGTGTPLCKVDFVAFEDKVEQGDWFFTSGDDRIFPRGLPVGVVKSVHPAVPYKEIILEPSGMAHGGPEDVLIVVEGVHQEIPENPPQNQQVYLGPPPPAATPLPGALANPDGTPIPDAAHPTPGTEADNLRSQYRKSAEGSGVTLGGGPTGLTWTPKPPDFTKLPVDPRSINPGRGSPAAAPLARKSTAPALETKGTGSQELKPDAVRRANQAAGPGGGNNRP